MIPESLSWEWLDLAPGETSRHELPVPHAPCPVPRGAALRLRFTLPPGAYATSLIREFIEVGLGFPTGADTPD